MHTGSPFTPPERDSRQGGRGSALFIGGAAFAVVFLLIVGLTVGYLVLRTGSGEPRGGAASTSATVTTPSGGELTDSGTDDPDEPGTDDPSEPAEEERCWSPPYERTSSNPSGRLRGGGLEFIPPSEYDNRSTPDFISFLNDSQMASAHVEATWYSTLIVGKVEWQPGVDYPGNEAAAERILDCLYGHATIWGETSNRSLHEEVTEPVTIAGMPGYRTRAVVKFGEHDLTRTDSTEIIVVVVETPEGPSAFISETALGVDEHEEGSETAYGSLTGLSG